MVLLFDIGVGISCKTPFCDKGRRSLDLSPKKDRNLRYLHYQSSIFLQRNII